MKTANTILGVLALAVVSLQMSNSQTTFEAGNKIDLTISITVAKQDSSFGYHYILGNGTNAKQEIVRFFLISPNPFNIYNLRAPASWRYVIFHTNDLIIKWLAEPKDEIEGYVDPLRPGDSKRDFAFGTVMPPGLVTYFAEGNHPIPTFPEGMAEDSIPGYSDLTAYGPGIVGKTVGPVVPPTPFIATTFLDTLISYKHQAVGLGWLRDRREEERDEDDEEKEDGIVTRLDKRLDKVRGALVKGDSAKARQELEKFVKKVERLRKRTEEAEQRQRDREVVMTGEAYALLKFNAEYLIDRLPIKQKKGKEKVKWEQ